MVREITNTWPRHRKTLNRYSRKFTMYRFVVRSDRPNVITNKVLIGHCDFAQAQPQKIGPETAKLSITKPEADASSTASAKQMCTSTIWQIQQFSNKLLECLYCKPANGSLSNSKLENGDPKLELIPTWNSRSDSRLKEKKTSIDLGFL